MANNFNTPVVQVANIVEPTLTLLNLTHSIGNNTGHVVLANVTVVGTTIYLPGAAANDFDETPVWGDEVTIRNVGAQATTIQNVAGADVATWALAAGDVLRLGVAGSLQWRQIAP